MRLTFVIAMTILFGLAAYAKLLAMAQSPASPTYGPLPSAPAIHLAHAGIDE